jgi:B-Raf proto-oncogene serine/threonine-protein kinase
MEYNGSAMGSPLEIHLELENVQSVIQLTKENIDALNERFSKLKPSPKIYLEEYQDLTSKLHDLKIMEQNLVEKMQSEQQLQNEVRLNLNILTTFPVLTPSFFLKMESRAIAKPPKLFLRAHLPNQQRTSVQVVPGMRLRDALAKALSRRNMTFDMCEVYQSDTDIPIPWDTDISSLNCDEISVKILDVVGFPTYISHQFIRKTFFSLAFCECCRRLLFTGFYCNQCNYRFHQRCVDKVPPLCSKLQMDTYYQMLLAGTDNSYAGSSGHR